MSTWQRVRNTVGARGVTLIEILIVIAIILILMGLLMTALGGVRMRAKVRATRLLLDGMSASLHRYHMDFDEFPDSFGSPAYNIIPANDYHNFEDNGGLYTQLNGEDGTGPIRSPGTPYEKRFSPYLPLQPENMKREGTTVYIVDHFDPPSKIYYFNCEAFIRCYVAKSPGAPGAKAQAESMVHRRDFELFSIGANHETDDVRHDMTDDNSDGRIDDRGEYDGKDEDNDLTNWD